MVWITGTATGHLDMFSKLRTHITANGWTVFDYVTAGAAPNQYSMQCKGPGMGVGYETHFCMRTFANPSSNEYCFEMNGTTDYVSGLGWDDQPGKSPQSIFMRLWNSTMPYWLSITNRRILLVIKASNTYHSMHMGFFLPFANPVEYPYPFYMASDASYIGTFAEVGANVRSIATPAETGLLSENRGAYGGQ